jgi:hypothetical protein
MSMTPKRLEVANMQQIKASQVISYNQELL